MIFEDYSGALSDLDRCIELDSSKAAAFQHRGMSKAFLGDHTGAVEDLTHCSEPDSSIAAAWLGRANALPKPGRRAGAPAGPAAALALRPSAAGRRVVCAPASCAPHRGPGRRRCACD